MGTSALRVQVFTQFAFLILGARIAFAQTGEVALPALPLSAALKQLGQETNTNILFTPSSVEGMRTVPLKGRMSALDALAVLLKGTELTAVPDDSGGIIVRGFVPTAPQNPVKLEQIVVTGTRVVREGYSAPPPVLVVSRDDLRRSAEARIFNSVKALPRFAMNLTTQSFLGGASSGNIGISALNLRGLGTNRTLVLLDGERLPGSNLSGILDIDQLPGGLIQRVDVLTGGASASWGSDAVAGVVNFVLDRNFNGVAANMDGGLSTYGDDRNVHLQATAGSSFAAGRGHIEGTLDFGLEDGVGRPHTRPWYVATKIIPQSPSAIAPGAPLYINSPNVYETQVANGGIITGRGTSLSAAMVGTTFGAGGIPQPFRFGSFVSGLYMIGGDSSADFGDAVDLVAKLERSNLFARISYEISPATEVFGTLLYGAIKTTNTSLYGVYKPGNLTLQCDNPFLDSAIASACGGAGHFLAFGSGNPFAPNTVVTNQRIMRRYTAGADGILALGEVVVTWNGYLSHGENDVSNRDAGETITNLYNDAIDAVRDPSGQIICRSSQARAQGCKPLNIVGTGMVPSDVVAWLTGTAFKLTNAREEVAALALNSEPFEIGTGPVSLAAGVEYREEAYDTPAVDPYSAGDGGNPLLNPQGNNWFTGNFHGSQGSFHVSEAYLETVVPVLSGQGLGAASLNLAGRAARYSTAGYVSTWKASLEFAPNILPGVKFHALQSRDIRAPNLSEISSSSTNTQVVTDDFPPNAGSTFTVSSPTVGNRQLIPEKGATTEIGFEFRQNWLGDFSLSADYYRIALKEAIGALTSQQEMDLCFAGNQLLCSTIVRDASGAVSQITIESFNLSSMVTDGFDFEIGDNFSADSLLSGLMGTISIKVSATHVSKFIVNPGVIGQPNVEYAGSNFGNAITNLGGLPLWSVLAQQNYENTTFGLYLTEHWLSPGKLDRSFIQCGSLCPAPTTAHPTINNNVVNGALYFDLAGQYNVGWSGLRGQVYFKIDNLTNTAPPASPNFGNPGAILNNGVNQNRYDVIGRMYRIGLRVTE